MNIRKFFIRAIKLNLCLNGWDHEDPGSMPEGLNEGFIVNILAAWAVCYAVGATETHTVVAICLTGIYTFFFGFLINPLIKWGFNVKFPTGDRFYLPQKIDPAADGPFPPLQEEEPGHEEG